MLSLFTLLNVEAMKAMDDAETPMRRGDGDCPWSQPFTGSPCLGLLGFRECHYGSRSCGFGAGNTPVRTARVISVCQDFQWVNQYPSCPRGLNNSPWNNNPWNNNPWNNPPRRQWAQTCTTGDWNMMMCGDDSQCNVDTEGWACCAGRGGRAKCPGSHPYMCNTRICNGEWCCAPEAGICQGGVRRDGCGNRGHHGMRMMEMMASPDTTGPKPKPGFGGGRRLETLEGLTDLSNELMTPEDALGAPESQAAVVVAGTPVTRRLGKKGELCRSRLNPDGRCDYALKCVNEICRRDMSRRLDDAQ